MDLQIKDLKKLNYTYYFSRFNWLAGCIPSVFLIWQRDGLEFSKIIYLQGLFGLMIIILEFPSGILADRFSRKSILFFATVNIALGSLTYSFAHGFNQFLFAEFLFAIGFAFTSGSDTALVWDSYVSVGKENNAKQILAKGNSFMAGSAILLTILGGILMNFVLTLPLLITSGMYLTLAFMYLTVKEPERVKQKETKLIWIHTLSKLKLPYIWAIICFVMINNIVLRIVFWGYIPKLQSINVDQIWFGFVLAGANFIMLIVSLYYQKNTDPSNKIISLFLMLTGIGVILFVFELNLMILLLAIMFHQCGRATIRYLSMVKINENVSSDIRASAISMIMSVNSILYWLVATLINHFDLELKDVMILQSGIVILIFILIPILGKNKFQEVSID